MCKNLKCILLLLCYLSGLNVGAQTNVHKRLTNLPHIYINTFTGKS